MSAPAFTPGPWQWGLDDLDAIWAPSEREGNVVCLPPDERLAASLERWQANAHLIAASPDLYRFVEDSGCLCEPYDDQFCTRCELLAKARGEA